MRDIWEKKKIITSSKKISKGKFAWELDIFLLAKCQNVITSQKFPRQFTSLSDLIKQSLRSYQAGKLKLTTPRPLGNSKRQISVRLPQDLQEFYWSIPSGQRTELVELVLLNYLEKFL